MRWILPEEPKASISFYSHISSSIIPLNLQCSSSAARYYLVKVKRIPIVMILQQNKITTITMQKDRLLWTFRIISRRITKGNTFCQKNLPEECHVINTISNRLRLWWTQTKTIRRWQNTANGYSRRLLAKKSEPKAFFGVDCQKQISSYSWNYTFITKAVFSHQ